MSTFSAVLLICYHQPTVSLQTDLYDVLKSSAIVVGNVKVLNVLTSTTRTKFDAALVYCMLLSSIAVLLPIKLQSFQMSYEAIYNVSDASNVNRFTLTGMYSSSSSHPNVVRSLLPWWRWSVSSIATVFWWLWAI